MRVTRHNGIKGNEEGNILSKEIANTPFPSVFLWLVSQKYFKINICVLTRAQTINSLYNIHHSHTNLEELG